MNNKTYSNFISFVVALGGFLFGFDAGIISGVMSFAGPEYDLRELSNLVNALTFFLFGAVAFVGFFILLRILPKTKGKSLEELEMD